MGTDKVNVPCDRTQSQPKGFGQCLCSVFLHGNCEKTNNLQCHRNSLTKIIPPLPTEQCLIPLTVQYLWHISYSWNPILCKGRDNNLKKKKFLLKCCFNRKIRKCPVRFGQGCNTQSTEGGGGLLEILLNVNWEKLWQKCVTHLFYSDLFYIFLIKNQSFIKSILKSLVILAIWLAWWFIPKSH